MTPEAAKGSDKILREIATTRNDMDQTLTAIEGMLTPGRLLDQGMDYFRGSGANEFARNLGHSVKSNPIPVALVGIGLAWLMANGRHHQPSADSSAHAGSLEAGTEGLGEAAHGAMDRMSEAAQGAKDRIGQAQDKVSGAMRSARDQMSRTGESARHHIDQARQGYDWMLREQPLAVGAIGVAIGALAAAAMPRTGTEDELMGEKRDELLDQVKDEGREKVEKMMEVGQEAMSAATAEPERQAITPAAESTFTPAANSTSPSPPPIPRAARSNRPFPG